MTAEERGQNKVYNDVPKHPQNKKKHQNKENKWMSFFIGTKPELRVTLMMTVNHPEAA